MVIIYSILTALFFTLTFFFRKTAANTISLERALVIEVFVELLFFSIIFITISNEKGFSLGDKGNLFAVLAGVAVSLGVAFNYLALKSGLLSKVTSITSPSQILFGVLLGILLLKEQLTAIQMLGVAFGVISILLLSL